MAQAQPRTTDDPDRFDTRKRCGRCGAMMAFDGFEHAAADGCDEIGTWTCSACGLIANDYVEGDA